MDKTTTIPFDQYQRYGIACRAIESIRRNGESLNILEVGSNTHQLLGRLLPNDNIVYLDREVPLEMQKQDDMILGDATDLTLPDASFDVVVALDVFEHIPKNSREAFLNHTCRVARLLTVIGAPFDSPLTVKAEQEASDYWESLFHQPYRWLAEHAENGLPNLVASTQAVAALGYHQHTLKHGDINLWTTFIKGHFAEVYVGSLQPMLSLLYRYYQCSLFERDFSTTNTYRQFLLCSRDADVINKIKVYFDELEVKSHETTSSDFILELLNLIPSIATDIHAQIVSLNQTIAERDAAIAERDATIKIITSSHSWRVTRPFRFLLRQFRNLLNPHTKK